MPTPAAQEPGTLEDYHRRLREARPSAEPTFVPLSMLVKQLPTPRSSDGPKGGPGQTGDGLQPAVTMLPTPTAALAGGVQSLERQTIPERDAASMLPTPRATRGGSHTETQRMLPTPMAGDAKSARNSTATRHTTPPTGVHAGDTLSDVAYADRWGDYAPAIARWEQILGRTAPDPTDVKGRLSPAFVEWMMGWPEGWTDVGLSRANRLKILGNGVVPLQAIAAYGGLIERQGVAA